MAARQGVNSSAPPPDRVGAGAGSAAGVDESAEAEALAVSVVGAGAPAAHAGSNSCWAGGVLRFASRARRSAAVG